MKLAYPVLAVMFVAALSGCGDRNPPKPDVPAVSASEALKADQRDIEKRFAEQKAGADAALEKDRAKTERQQSVDALTAVAQRLAAGIRDAGVTARSDFAALIKRVEALKAEANALPVDDCTSRVRANLLDNISATLDAFNSFAKETGAASEASKQKLTQAVDQLDAIAQELGACRSL